MYGDDGYGYGAPRTLSPKAGGQTGAGLGAGLTWQQRAQMARQIQAGQQPGAAAPGAMPEPGIMQIAPPDQMQQGAPGGAGGGSWTPWIIGAVLLTAAAGGGYWYYTSRKGKKSKSED